MTRPTTSDHFDGRRFFNPGVSTDKDFRELFVLLTAGQRRKWPRHVAVPPAVLPAEPGPGEIQVTFIGHDTLLVRVAGCTLITDPWFSELASPFPFAGPRRVREPAIALDRLPRIDAVLLSHNHYDHMDLPSLRELRRRWRTPIVTGLANGTYLKRKRVEGAVELDWWETVEIGADVRVTYLPAQHWSSRSLRDRRRMLWGGHWIDTPAGSIFFAGDTGYGPHFAEIRQRLGRPDVALLPIGAYAPRWFMQTQHMDPDDAVRAHLELGAGTSIGMHFGTIQLTDEAIDAPAEELALALAQHGVRAGDFRVPGFGETMSFFAGGARPAGA